MTLFSVLPTFIIIGLFLVSNILFFVMDCSWEATYVFIFVLAFLLLLLRPYAYLSGFWLSVQVEVRTYLTGHRQLELLGYFVWHPMFWKALLVFFYGSSTYHQCAGFLVLSLFLTGVHVVHCRLLSLMISLLVLPSFGFIDFCAHCVLSCALPPFPAYSPTRACIADTNVEAQIEKLNSDAHGFLGSWTFRYSGNKEEDQPEDFNCYAYDQNTIGTTLRKQYKLCYYVDFILQYPVLDLEGSEDQDINDDDIILVELSKGAEGDVRSEAGKRAVHQQICDRYLHLSYAQLRSVLGETTIDEDLWPSETTLRSRQNYVRGQQTTRTRTEWVPETQQFCEAHRHRDGIPEEEMFVLDDYIANEDECLIGFTCMYFVNCFINFLRQSPGSLYISCDATYSLIRRKYALIALNVIGHHFTRQVWRQTSLPVLFVCARSESHKAVEFLVSGLKEICDKWVNTFDVFDRVALVFTDRAPGYSLIEDFSQIVDISYACSTSRKISSRMQRRSQAWMHKPPRSSSERFCGI